jgi:hypothetical protein
MWDLTGYRLDGQDSSPDRGKDTFFSAPHSGPFWGPASLQNRCKSIPGTCSQWVKWSELEADHFHETFPRSRIDGIVPPRLLICFLGVVLRPGRDFILPCFCGNYFVFENSYKLHGAELLLEKPIPRSCVILCNKMVLYCREMLAPHPSPKLEDHPLSAVRKQLLIKYIHNYPP